MVPPPPPFSQAAVRCMAAEVIRSVLAIINTDRSSVFCFVNCRRIFILQGGIYLPVITNVSFVEILEAQYFLDLIYRTLIPYRQVLPIPGALMLAGGPCRIDRSHTMRRVGRGSIVRSRPRSSCSGSTREKGSLRPSLRRSRRRRSFGVESIVHFSHTVSGSR